MIVQANGRRAVNVLARTAARSRCSPSTPARGFTAAAVRFKEEHESAMEKQGLPNMRVTEERKGYRNNTADEFL